MNLNISIAKLASHQFYHESIILRHSNSASKYKILTAVHEQIKSMFEKLDFLHQLGK